MNYDNRGMGGQPQPQRQGSNRRNNRNFNNRNSRFDQPYQGGFQNHNQNRNFNNQGPKQQPKEQVKPEPQSPVVVQKPEAPAKQEVAVPVQQQPAKPANIPQVQKTTVTPNKPQPVASPANQQSRPTSAQASPQANQQAKPSQPANQQNNQQNNARAPAQQNVAQQNIMRPPGQQNQQQNNGPPKNQPNKNPINANATQQQNNLTKQANVVKPQQGNTNKPQTAQNNNQQNNPQQNNPQQNNNQQNKPPQNQQFSNQNQFNQNQNQYQNQLPQSNYSSTTSINKAGQDQPQRGGGGGGRGGGRRTQPGDKTGPGREEHFMMTKLKELGGSMVDLQPLDQPEQKFSGRNRLYIGNLTNDVTEEELLEVFNAYGETSELFVNKEKNFAFIRIDYKANAEKAKREVDGRMRRGRPLRVRFAPHNAAIKVKNLTPFVSNELLYKAFEIFGKVERAIVKVDERGKSLGEGVVEFFRKAAALAATRHCNDRCFFLTASLRPVVVEPFDEVDEMDGYTEKAIPRRGQDFLRAREMGPRFAEPGSFEHEYGTRWKQLHELFKQKEEALKREMIMEEDKLEAQMEYAKYEHETELLREQLRQREQDRERQKRSWEMAERQADEQREKERESLLRQEEEMATRMRLQEDELMRRQQENTLFMKAQQLNRILDQQEQGLGGGRGYDNPLQEGKRGGYDNIGGMQMDSAYGMESFNSMGGGGSHMGYEDGLGRWDSRQEDFPNKRRRY